MVTVETERLLVRRPIEADRARFVELFVDPEFMVFGKGALTIAEAERRFNHMVELSRRITYAKQPVIEKATGTIIGYTGVGVCAIDDVARLEWGWRFATSARGRGYATEAAAALLNVAHASDNGEMLCIIAADNALSHRVAEKLGFVTQRQIIWPADQVVTDLLVLRIGLGGEPLLAPSSLGE